MKAYIREGIIYMPFMLGHMIMGCVWVIWRGIVLRANQGQEYREQEKSMKQAKANCKKEHLVQKDLISTPFPV